MSSTPRWVVFVVAVGVATALGPRAAGPAPTAAAPYQIASLALAGRSDTAVSILDSWGDAGRRLAVESLVFDLPFLVAFYLALGMACVWAREPVRRRGWLGLAAAGALIARGQALAGVLDVLEDIALAAVLISGPETVWVSLATLCAIPKFVLVGDGLLYVAAGVVARLTGLRARP